MYIAVLAAVASVIAGELLLLLLGVCVCIEVTRRTQARAASCMNQNDDVVERIRCVSSQLRV